MIAGLSERGRGLLNVQSGEERSIILMFLMNFFLSVSFLYVQTAGYALYLDRFGTEGIAILYIAVAIITPLPAFIYLRISKRLSVQQFLIGNYVFVLLGTIAFYVGTLTIQSDVLIFAIPIWLEVHMSFGILAVWTTAGYLFDLRQSKRLLGLIGSGEYLALTVLGLLVPFTVAIVGTLGLIGLACVAMAIATLLMIIIVRSNPETLSGHAAESDDDTSKNNKATTTKKPVRFDQYSLLIMGLVVVWWVGFSFTDYVFLGGATLYFADPDQLAGVLAFRIAIGGLLGLLISTFVTGRVLKRFGLRFGLLIMPVVLLVLFVGISLANMLEGSALVIFALAATSKVLNQAIGRSIDKTSQVILFQPLSDKIRVRLQTWAEAIIQPIAIGVSGFVIFLLGNILNFGLFEFAMSFIVFGIIWIAIVVGLLRQYPKMLLRALESRQLSFDNDDTIDEASIAMIDEGLRSIYPGAVVYSVQLLEQTNSPDLASKLCTLLDHPSEDVRAYALERLQVANDKSTLDAIRKRIPLESSPRIKSSALRTVLSIGSDDVFNEILFYLDDNDSSLKQGAIIALLQSGGIDGIMAAGNQLNLLLGSADENNRVIAAQILGEVGLELFYQPILPLLEDESMKVRYTAILAAGKIGNSRLWSHLIQALYDPSTRSVARTALASGGESVIPEVAIALNQSDLPQYVVLDLIRVCERIGTNNLVALLKNKIDYPDATVRTAILRALRQNNYRATESEQSRVIEQIKSDAQIATVLLSTKKALEGNPQYQIIVDALETSLNDIQQQQFDLLSFVFDRQIILAAQKAYRYGEGNQKSYALELIDNVLTQNIKGYVLPILDQDNNSSGMTFLQAVYPQPKRSPAEHLSQIIKNEGNFYSFWTQACAVYIVLALKLDDFQDAITIARQNTNRLVHHIANWSTPQNMEYSKMSFSLVEKVLILKTVGIFSEVPNEILVEVAEYLELVEYDAGTQIFQKGDAGDSMYIIISGKIHVFDDDKTLDRLGARTVFGELALLDDQPRMASVSTIEDTRLFRLDQGIFRQLMETQVGLAHGVINVLMRYFRQSGTKIETVEVQLPNLLIGTTVEHPAVKPPETS